MLGGETWISLMVDGETQVPLIAGGETCVPLDGLRLMIYQS